MRELGKSSDIIKYSHKAIEIWKTVIDNPLSVNGLIFSYTDLGLLFSDSNLNSLSIKYLDKAKSLIPICKNHYNPTIKLYIAYAVVYDRMKKFKKSRGYYENVIDIVLKDPKNDISSLIPILINMSSDLIRKSDFKGAKQKCDKALEISKNKKDKIYRPYIYHSFGKIYLNLRDFKKSEKYLKKSLEMFSDMSLDRMAYTVKSDIAEKQIKQKKYDDAKITIKTIMNDIKKNNDLEQEINQLKKLETIYKETKNNQKLLITTNRLNTALEDQIKKNEKKFSDLNSSALKYLTQEMDLSIKRESHIKQKLKIEAEKRKKTTDVLISASEREFLKILINKLSNEKLDTRKIINLCKQRIHTTKKWNIFISLFDEIHPYFNKSIIELCPKITDSELRVCNLIMMKFSSLEIANILSVSKRGVEQHKYRIKKKLNLESDLSIFLQSI